MIPHKVKLSGELSVIAEIIGFGLALRLAHEFGGHEVKIPKTPKAGHRLVDCIGITATLKLTAHYGEGYIDIPMGPKSNYNQFIRSQAQQIDHALGTGKNNVQVAREVGCTVRTVRAHKNGKSNPDVPDLFD